MSHDFRIDVVTDGGPPASATIHVSGDFDAATVPEFDRRTGDLPGTAEAVVVDVGAASVIDSSALGALIRLRERCNAADVGFTTLVRRPFQRKLLHHTGLNDVLGVHDSPTDRCR